MGDSVQSIAYDEASKAITAQAGVLDNLRTRAGAVVSVATLVTSFFGGQALAKPSLSGGSLNYQAIGTWGWIAVGCLGAVALMSLAILAPWNWRFVLGASTILGYEGEATPEEIKAHLARINEKNYDWNEKKLDRLFWCLRLAVVFLALETVAWIIDLT